MDFDLVIRGGSVVDGTGDRRAFRADVGISGDRIAAVDRLDGASAARVIGASGHIVSPGFIDAHVHSEAALRGGPGREGSVLQGVTTHLTAPDGFGWAPLAPEGSRDLWRATAFAYGNADFAPDWRTAGDYLDGFAGSTPVNVVAMAPHQAIRFAVLGWEPRAATDAELDRMRDLVRHWMDAGAVGLSTGLDYQPAASSDTRELVELCRVVRRYGGVYAAHQRYTALGRAAAWRESIEVGRQAGVPVCVSHERVDDESEPLLADAAAACDLSFDSYLYPAGSTHLLYGLPLADQAGGPDAVLERLADPAYRERLARHLEAPLAESVAGGARAYFSATRTGRHVGRSLADLAAARGRSLGETAVDLIREEVPDALLVYHRGLTDEAFEQVTRATIAHPAMTVASDGIYHAPLPHPRGFGCFARILRYFVRELRAITLEEAIHKMSGFPAERYRLRDRGRLAAGYGADVVVFDPATVADRATWEEPRLPPVGIQTVIVNGEPVVEQGRFAGRLPGRVLRPLQS